MTTIATAKGYLLLSNFYFELQNIKTLNKRWREYFMTKELDILNEIQENFNKLKEQSDLDEYADFEKQVLRFIAGRDELTIPKRIDRTMVFNYRSQIFGLEKYWNHNEDIDNKYDDLLVAKLIKSITERLRMEMVLKNRECYCEKELHEAIMAQYRYFNNKSNNEKKRERVYKTLIELIKRAYN